MGHTERDHLITLVQAGRLIFLRRWPQASSHVNADTLADEAAPSRLYEITVTSWILFDEDSYPDQPRRPLPAHQRCQPIS